MRRERVIKEKALTLGGNVPGCPCGHSMCGLHFSFSGRVLWTALGRNWLLDTGLRGCPEPGPEGWGVLTPQ